MFLWQWCFDKLFYSNSLFFASLETQAVSGGEVKSKLPIMFPGRFDFTSPPLTPHASREWCFFSLRADVSYFLKVSDFSLWDVCTQARCFSALFSILMHRCMDFIDFLFRFFQINLIGDFLTVLKNIEFKWRFGDVGCFFLARYDVSRAWYDPNIIDACLSLK